MAGYRGAPSSSSGSSSGGGAPAFATRVLLLLTLLPPALAAFAFALQWRGGMRDPTGAAWPADTQRFPGMENSPLGSSFSSSPGGGGSNFAVSSASASSVADDCSEILGRSASSLDSDAGLIPKAGSGQESVNCMPCSRTYVADAYLDALTSQHAQHRDLTELPDPVDLCKGLADDLDVPRLSELHRQLVGEGSHRRLVYSVKFGNCQDAIVKFLDGYDANLVIIEKLPSGVFADPFELQHFIERKAFLDVAVFGDTNLELPSALSNLSAVEIHFDLKPSTSMNCNLVVELPLHARYPPLDASGYATVEFGSPDLLLRYRKKETHSDSCLWMLKNLDAMPAEKAAWRIPCGDEAHTGFVSSITFLAALVCSMSIVLAASLIP